MNQDMALRTVSTQRKISVGAGTSTSFLQEANDRVGIIVNAPLTNRFTLSLATGAVLDEGTPCTPVMIPSSLPSNNTVSWSLSPGLLPAPPQTKMSPSLKLFCDRDNSISTRHFERNLLTKDDHLMNTRLCLYCQEIPGLQGHGCLACNIANNDSSIFREDSSFYREEMMGIQENGCLSCDLRNNTSSITQEDLNYPRDSAHQVHLPLDFIDFSEFYNTNIWISTNKSGTHERRGLKLKMS